MTRHVVAQPPHQDRLRQVPPARDGHQGEVPCSDGHAGLAEQDHVARCRDETAGQREAVPVAETVADPCRRQGGYERDGVDGDAHDLGADGRPAHLVEDGGREEGYCVAGVDDAEVHDRSAWVSQISPRCTAPSSIASSLHQR